MRPRQGSRTFTTGAAIAMTVGLLAACSSGGGNATGGDTTAEKIRVLAVQGPETDALAAHSKNFTEESGIDVQIDKVARDIWSQRKVAELAQDAGTYDVVFLGGGDDALWMKTNAHVRDLTQYLGEDLIADIANHELFTTEDGEFVGAPQYFNFPMIFYRADLFEDPDEQAAFKAEYGRELAPPTTYDELVDIATFFNRPDDELYGTCVGGIPSSIFGDHTYITYGQGANYGDLDTGELTLDTPEQVKTLQILDQLTALNPPGWEEMNFFDCDNRMKEGSIAIYQNWLYAWDALSPEMGDKLAMAPPPGEETHIGSMLATIPEAASNPDAAGQFIEWMLSDEYQLAQTEQTGNLPALESQQDSQEFAAVLPQMEMLKSVTPRLTYLHVTWAGELSTGVADAIAKVYSDEMTAEEATDWLQNEKFAGREAIE